MLYKTLLLLLLLLKNADTRPPLQNGRKAYVLLSRFPLLLYPASRVDPSIFLDKIEGPLLAGYCYLEANGQNHIHF